jgi:hypothetical protein
MILTGEGKLHADNLPSYEYYCLNKTNIKQHLFCETRFGLRFAPVILETIKKTHKTLPYILRNQYTTAKEVYSSVIDIPKHVMIANSDSAYCFHIFNRMSTCPILAAYFQDVFRYLIDPVYKRFGYFSPVMTVVLLMGLLCIVGDAYANQKYALVWKHFIKDGYPMDIVKAVAKNLSTEIYEMVCDEFSTWNQ